MNYDNKIFKLVTSSTNGEVSFETTFQYKQQGNILTAKYSGGKIVEGHLIGIVDNAGNIEMKYHHINDLQELCSGKCSSTPEVMSNGKIRLHEKWQWTSGDFSKGKSIIEEV